MLAVITLPEIQSYAYHGIEDWERNLGQPFSVSLKLWLPAEAAAKTDQLNETVDYVEVHRLVIEMLEASPVALLEHLAFRILTQILDRFQLLTKAWISIRKLRARLNHRTQSVAVELALRRPVER